MYDDSDVYGQRRAQMLPFIKIARIRFNSTTDSALSGTSTFCLWIDAWLNSLQSVIKKKKKDTTLQDRLHGCIANIVSLHLFISLKVLTFHLENYATEPLSRYPIQSKQPRNVPEVSTAFVR